MSQKPERVLSTGSGTERKREGVGVKGQSRLKLLCRDRGHSETPGLVLINNAIRTGAASWPYTFIASDSVEHLHLGLLRQRVHVNGLNSELTPAWRGREAVTHVNQPTCFYLVQNKVKFCSNSYQRSDETPEFIHTQVQSLEVEVCLSSNFPLQQNQKTLCYIVLLCHNNKDGTWIQSLSSLF